MLAGEFMATKIITDSTSYIPHNLLKKYSIDVLSLSVVFRDEQYLETEITNEFFFNKLANSAALPTSSQISVDLLYSTFEQNVSNGDGVVGIFLSADMSGTYATALLAKNMILENYPNAQIEIIDSRSNCMQLGYAVLAAAKVASQNLSIQDVVQAAKENIKRSKFIFIPDTLEYLKKGGRIGAASALLGSLIQIKPILTVAEGKVKVLGKIRTKKRAVKTLVQMFIDDIEQHGFGEAIVHHINCETEALALAKEIESVLHQQVLTCPIGPVIGTHVGPGAIGIAYYTEKPLSVSS